MAVLAMCLVRQEHGGQSCSGKLCQRETPRAGERYAVDARGGVGGTAAGDECGSRPRAIRGTPDASLGIHATGGLAASHGGGWGAGEEGSSEARAGTSVVYTWHTGTKTARPRHRAAGF